MKRFLIIMLIIAVGFCGFFVGNVFKIINILENRRVQRENQSITTIEEYNKYYNTTPIEDNNGAKTGGAYKLYVDNSLHSTYNSFEEAVEQGKKLEHVQIRQVNKSLVLWDNYPPFLVFNDTDGYAEYSDFTSAIAKAKTGTRSFVYHRKDNSLLWTNTVPIEMSVSMDIDVILQNPELPRGCEVTSLAMLINYKGLKVGKLQLADEIKKDTTPYRVSRGVVHYGNPNVGFVGDMRNKSLMGYGVYHKPIHQLLSEYFPFSAVDFTGCDFYDLFYLLNSNTPIWVITNTTYKKLPQSEFSTWVTNDGPIKITFKEHAVLVTGYDDKYIYFNDPLSGKNKANAADFIEAWIQMGRQAVAAVH